jgi:AraC family transcriptional regulator of adaptative response/methylated-DNA-[protein]-cysteine methyltransferase
MSDASLELQADGGFRAVFDKVFAIASVKSDRPACVYMDCLESPVGPLIAAANDEAVCLLEFTDRLRLETQLRALQRNYAGAIHRDVGNADLVGNTDRPIQSGTNHWLEALRVQLQEYFAGQRQRFDLPLSYRGTVFQEKVWSTLLTIGYGETWSYRQLAERIGDPAATRAVGTANGMNRIAIVIPCHRVINANGELGGYGGGLWRKRILLDLEKGQGRLDI